MSKKLKKKHHNQEGLLDHLSTKLNKIVSWDDTEIPGARTLHYTLFKLGLFAGTVYAYDKYAGISTSLGRVSQVTGFVALFDLVFEKISWEAYNMFNSDSLSSVSGPNLQAQLYDGDSEL